MRRLANYQPPLTGEDRRTRPTDPRAELLAGRRLRVTLRPGDGGLVYRRGDQFVYDVREGWAEGVVEPICCTDSEYIIGFLDGCDRIDVDRGEWVTIKQTGASV